MQNLTLCVCALNWLFQFRPLEALNSRNLLESLGILLQHLPFRKKNRNLTKKSVLRLGEPASRIKSHLPIYLILFFSSVPPKTHLNLGGFVWLCFDVLVIYLFFLLSSSHTRPLLVCAVSGVRALGHAFVSPLHRNFDVTYFPTGAARFVEASPLPVSPFHFLPLLFFFCQFAATQLRAHSCAGERSHI